MGVITDSESFMPQLRMRANRRYISGIMSARGWWRRRGGTGTGWHVPDRVRNIWARWIV